MRRTRRLIGPRLVVLAAVLGPFLWLFGSVLAHGQSFVYRDAAHYYYPLFEWTADQWSRGRVPLWNPQDNCGQPVVGQSTSSVFYPGKLIFVLPLEYALCYKLYVSLHVLLAALAAYLLARRWRASPEAAGICAVSYALGGNVLFQYCNVVFLVGAAWLPLALLATDGMLRRRRVVWALLLGAVLALMTLAGDPQAAYHAALLAVLYALLLWRRQRRGLGRRAAPITDTTADVPRCGSMVRLTRRLLKNPLALLALAAAAGAVLAAVQIQPSWEWTRHSDRASHVAPRNLYELAARSPRDTRQSNADMALVGLLGEPANGTHHEHVYHFSVGPWRLPELVWPNFSGRMFPTHRRWTAIIPAEGRVWTPSLYMGLLPLLLALGSWRVRGGLVHQRWLSWAALWAAVAALGWYGVGWVINELRCGLLGADPNQLWLGSPVGGLYWLMVVVLPGYVYFRYPAKLMVVAALAMSVLAALGWDRMCRDRPIVLRRVVAGLGLGSVAAAVVVLATAPVWKQWLTSVEGDDYFGPLDVGGAANDVLTAMLHAALLCGLLWWLLGRIGGNGSPRWAMAALLLTALELTVAHGWMIATIADDRLRTEPAAARQIAADRGPSKTDVREYRVYRASPALWRPHDWLTTSSAHRQSETLQWDRDTLLPKFHLPSGAALVASSGTLASRDYRMLQQVARDFGPRRPDHVAEPHPAVLEALAAKHLILPDDFAYRHTQRLDRAPRGQGQHENKNVVLWRSKRALPRAWIVHQVETLPALAGSAPALLRRRTERVFFPNGQPRDLRVVAVVETDERFPPMPSRAQASVDGYQESCGIVLDQPDRVEIAVKLNRPGLVVLSDLFYPGWSAQLESEGEAAIRGQPIWRTNRTMRGVYLPAGRHRLVYRYRPMGFYLGLALSAVGWLSLVAFLTASWWRRKSNQNTTADAKFAPADAKSATAGVKSDSSSPP